MKQTMIFIAFFALWMSVKAQETKKTLIGVPDTLSVYRVNTGTIDALIFENNQNGKMYCGQRDNDNIITIFPAIPDQPISGINDFAYFKKTGKFYAGSYGWSSGAHIYEYDPKTKIWTADPYVTDAGVTYIEQIKNGSILVMSGAFDYVNGQAVNKSFMTDGVTVSAVPNNGPIDRLKQVGNLMITCVPGVTGDIKITNTSNWMEESIMPDLPDEFKAADVVYDSVSKTMYASIFKAYTSSPYDYQLISAKSTDFTWTILLPMIGGPARLEWQNGYIVAYGSHYEDDTISSSSGLWLFDPKTSAVIDPVKGFNWCPENTTFIDAEAKGGSILFSASYLKKFGNNISLATMKFLPAPEKIASDKVPLKMYPNPASDYIVVQGVEKVVVTNLLGVPMLTSTDQKIDVSNFAPGMYFANGEPFIVTH